MTFYYPTSFETLQEWTKENNMPAMQARVHFAQYVVLHVVAASRTLRGFLVLKGGNALDFVCNPTAVRKTSISPPTSSSITSARKSIA